MAAVAASASAQRQFDELGKRGLPANDDMTVATAVGDVDGDGDLDLVVGNYAQQSRLYLNDGNGAFTDATVSRMPVGSYGTRALVLGDVDGDGDLDLVVGNMSPRNPSSFGQQNRLYLNNGTGTFFDMTATRMPVVRDITSSLALGDVDGDGDLDLIVGNGLSQFPDRSRLHLNDGTGTFSDATSARMPPFSISTNSVALGDVDQDGDLDLVLGNSWPGYGEQNRLYLNNGNGTFTDATATRMPVLNDSTTSLALGDVDGDGDLDLIVGNDVGWQSRLHLNNGTGTFTDATASRMPAVSQLTRALALGDVDQDGDLDLILGNGLTGAPQQNRLYRNDGTGTFSDSTTSGMSVDRDFTSSLALGDMDGDGDMDLVLGNGAVFQSAEPNRLYWNDGSGTFADTTNSRLPTNPDNTNALVLGDVDGDGDSDLVVGNYGHFLGEHSRLFLNDGTGTFADESATRMPVGSYLSTSLAMGDVDGDGDLDLVLGNYDQQSRLYLNNGAGIFTDATAPGMPAGSYATRALAMGDVDGDGDLDLVLGNDGRSQGEQSRLYLNNGTGTFTDATAAQMPVGGYFTLSLKLGDVDGDGDLDMVLGNLNQQSRLYLNDGAGRFTDATASRMPVGSDSTSSLALGDVDGDGDLDLVVGNHGRQSRLYLNNGAGGFTDATASHMPVGSYPIGALALDDLDEDGDVDLVLGNDSQRSRIYRNDGSGRFTDAGPSIIPLDSLPTTSLALGDVDADGDLDLVVGNFLQRNRLYQNLHRHLDAPYVLHIGGNYRLDVYSRFGPAGTTDIAFALLSGGTANIPFPPFGTIGIDITQMIALPPFAVPQPAGIGSLTITVPNLPSLAGLTFYTQALLNQQPVQARFTNVVRDVTLR